VTSRLSLATRALLAIALMIGFYVLAIVIAAGLLYVPYAEVVYAHRIHFRLVVFCVVGAGIILWSIVPRRDRFLAPGPRLDARENPNLFRELTTVAKAVDQEMPTDVYLVPDVNAWVAHRGGVMGFGSRRVMGLGLPLLQILTVSQLRAVLAHEFGHYYGGDTKLGPWVYKTRAAIGRTLLGLSQHRSVLVYLFLWYGNMFLRITHAISRRQEFTADELAARVVGPQPLIEGLKAIHGASMAYTPYWNTEATPILGAGFRPPLAEGFARFVKSSSISQIIARSLEKELAEGKADPFDTHPPLRERIAAVGSLPSASQPASDGLAITLLGSVDDLEKRWLAMVAGEEKVRVLKPVKWDEAGTRVFLPLWENMVGEQAAVLKGVTPRTLPELARDLTAPASKVKNPPGELPGPEQRAEIAADALGAAIALTLHRQGWTIHALPGELYFQRGDLRIEPFMVCRRLASGELTPETWYEQCAREGLSDLRLDVVASGQQLG
jgi:heat shock protein HtpX